MNRDTKRCEYCGNDFFRPTRYYVTEANWAKRRFCSRNCSTKAVWIEKNGALRPTCQCGCGTRVQYPKKWVKAHKPDWRGKTKDGYIRLWRPGHPLASKHGFVFEHRYVVFEAGIPIPRGHDVHHLNGVRDDNRLDNLQVLSRAAHKRLHMRREGVRNQYGVWKMAGSAEEKRIRDRDWMRAKRAALRQNAAP